LEDYEYGVVYNKGCNNTNADALSRIHAAEVCTNRQATDPELTKEERLAIFREMHDNPIGGHLGMNRTYDRVKRFTTWHGMKQKLEDYIRRCETCQKNKITQNKTKLPMKITTPEIVWEKCALDIVGPLILTFQNELSKYTLAVPIKQQDAMTVARAFVEEIVLKFGIPVSFNRSRFQFYE
jgi:hypothetical protein